MKHYENRLKIKGWKEPITLNEGKIEDKYHLKPQEKIGDWEKDQEISPEELRKEIEPWLTSLFQSENFSLLVGAGLTNSLHQQISEGLPKGFENHEFQVHKEHIEEKAKETAIKSGRVKSDGKSDINLEDQLRSANSLLEGLKQLTYPDSAYERIKRRLKKDRDQLKQEIKTILERLQKGILDAEKIIKSADSDKKEKIISQLVSFMMSFASRTGTRERLHIFTTNYDRVIEFGSELAGLRLIDRFVGNISPVFRASRLDVDFHYNPPGIRGEPRYLEGVAKFTKLHGSLDWVEENNNIVRKPLPFGAEEFVPYLGNEPDKTLIFPTESKDQETTGYPYVELFRDFAASICRPNTTLVTYGYSFGDEHINRVIRDMLTIPSTHLVMINFDDKSGRLQRFFSESNRPSQISILIGNHLGHLPNLVDYYLPKPAIDRASIKMADLMRARNFSDGREGKSSSKDKDETNTLE